GVGLIESSQDLTEVVSPGQVGDGIRRQIHHLLSPAIGTERRFVRVGNGCFDHGEGVGRNVILRVSGRHSERVEEFTGTIVITDVFSYLKYNVVAFWAAVSFLVTVHLSAFESVLTNGLPRIDAGEYCTRGP